DATRLGGCHTAGTPEQLDRLSSVSVCKACGEDVAGAVRCWCGDGADRAKGWRLTRLACIAHDASVRLHRGYGEPRDGRSDDADADEEPLPHGLLDIEQDENARDGGDVDDQTEDGHGEVGVALVRRGVPR